jgi:hypothetical protein
MNNLKERKHCRQMPHVIESLSQISIDFEIKSAKFGIYIRRIQFSTLDEWSGTPSSGL